MDNPNSIITVRTGGNSYEKFPSDYHSHTRYRQNYSWYDVFPFSLILWPHTFSESERVGCWWRERHHYHSLALELMLEGELQYEQNGQKSLVKKGDLYFSHPGNTIKIHSTAREYAHQLQLVISGNQVSILLENLELRQTFLFSNGNNKKIEEYFTRIGDLLLSKSSAVHACSQTFELLAWLAKEKIALEQSRLPPVLTKAVRIMGNELSRGHSITAIAEMSGTSKATLSRLFQKYCQCSPQVYYTTLKMEYASNLLKLNRYSCKEIAEQLGFRNALYFSTVFKRYSGLSPRQFQAAARREMTDPARHPPGPPPQQEEFLA